MVTLSITYFSVFKFYFIIWGLFLEKRNNPYICISKQLKPNRYAN